MDRGRERKQKKKKFSAALVSLTVYFSSLCVCSGDAGEDFLFLAKAGLSAVVAYPYTTSYMTTGFMLGGVSQAAVVKA